MPEGQLPDGVGHALVRRWRGVLRGRRREEVQFDGITSAVLVAADELLMVSRKPELLLVHGAQAVVGAHVQVLYHGARPACQAS